MLHFLKIDLKKLTSYRTFWVVCGLYFLTMGLTTSSGMEFLKWLERLGAQFGLHVNIYRIPFHHFPDVWMNLLFVAGFFKIILGFVVVISITNEFSYRTIRQNIIDGLSREAFLTSKVLTNVLLSLASVVLMVGVVLTTGFIFSPQLELGEILTDIEFVPAYFLEVFAYLSFALMLGLLIQRSGLTLVVLLLSPLMEFIVKAIVDDYLPWLIPFFPLESLGNLIHVPFPRYVFFEIQDYVSLGSVAIVLVWTFLFNYFGYLKLKKSDI
ncbi:MAG: hypothetical protein ACOYW3_10310 [Bacteroidota bacterium]